MRTSLLAGRLRRPGAMPLLALVLGLLLAGTAALAAVHRASAEDGCDPSEPVACIPLPPAPAQAAPETAPQPGSAISGAGAGAVAVPVPAQMCPAPFCCPPLAVPGVALPSSPVVPVPPGGCCPPPPPDPFGPPVPAYCCSPGPLPPSVAVPVSPVVPVPPPYFCPPYRSIYATINGGNVADVRALRTLSTAGLSNYWRGSALAQIQAEVGQLRTEDLYATTKLYSISVQDSSFTSPNTAVVHTMEHWLYQERLQGDETVFYETDEWVANEYRLTLIGNAWYITYNTATLVPAP